MVSVGTCSEPLNIRCSNRWASPVRPGVSFFDPAWYMTMTAATGEAELRCSMTVNPFARA